jgi:hypothetical protein
MYFGLGSWTLFSAKNAKKIKKMEKIEAIVMTYF